MKNDVQQLRDLIAPYDPAGHVRVDPAVMSTTSRAIVEGTTPACACHSGTTLVTATVVAHRRTRHHDRCDPRPGRRAARSHRPRAHRPAKAQALAFTRHGGFIDVQIIDPNADPQRYRREFAAHNMNVDLQMRSAPPSIVGTMISVDGDSGTGTSKVTAIDGSHGCGTMWCKAGVRIPIGRRGHVTIIFGRAARPGEAYALTGDPTARGEALQGLSLHNRTVADVRRMAGQRRVTIQRYFGEAPWERPGAEPPRNGSGWSYDEHVLDATRVPGTWYVHDAFTGRFPKTVELVAAPWPDDH